jgi:non-lysosomal glucosylceramidase
VLGGNRNTVADVEGSAAILMTNDDLAPDHPGAGSMALWSPDVGVAVPQFDDADAALAAVDALKLLTPVVLESWGDESVARAVAAIRSPIRMPRRPSTPGTTWAGGLALPFHVKPGESVTRRFVYAWHFPNRYADFDRFGASDDAAFTAPLIGNHYSERFTDAADVVSTFAKQSTELLDASRAWRDALYESGMPSAVVETLAAQPSLIRSPTLVHAADGNAFGFEGVLGESTLNWNGNVGGSCPLNCTHVWNYEQALSRLFPDLERTMRVVDWDVVQAPEGYLPHRVLLPLDGPQLHGVPVGGPTRPALDGMLGTILKTYREARQGGGIEWIARFLPNAQRLLDYISRTWDPDNTGLLTGDQPVTHDISLQGPNMFVGGLWLAALRSMQEMYGRLGDSNEAAALQARFEDARAAYDDALWNGEYYAQQSSGEEFDFGSGCLSDQLFGQWWAHQLGLGHILPPEHVRSALRAIVTYNMRESFRGFEHGYRVFADADDRGLLICTWPHGGRPSIPIRYADEVWTGVEYQVAAHCLFEGMVDEGLSIVAAVRGRYDGARRNPYNEIECGDHYSRAMSGWTLLEAYTGASYNWLDKHMTISTHATRYPILAVTGWGEIVVDASAGPTLLCRSGRIEIERVTIDGSTRNVVPGTILHAGDEVRIRAIT